MGYNTDFVGEFELDPPLTDDQATYLRRFAETRRMARHEHIVKDMPDPVREAVGLPIGKFGDFFVGSEAPFGQDMRHESVLGSSTAPGQDITHWDPALKDFRLRVPGYGPGDPRKQPGLWCQWTPDGTTHLVWDECEKFYNYVEWAQYLQSQILSRWGVTMSGRVYWYGEDREDFGVIIAEDGNVRAIMGKISYPEDPTPITQGGSNE